jgi:hypothetical protein
MPTWTDIGGFWASVGGFALAIALAIVGWVQAHGAKADARVAKEQADAAKRIADEAQRQTAAAETAAKAAQEQAEATIAAFDWETVPQLEIVAGPAYQVLDLSVDPAVQRVTSTWRLRNTGKAAAIRLTARMDFDPDGTIHGPQTSEELLGGKTLLLHSYRGVLPSFEEASSNGEPPVVVVSYTTPTGEERTQVKRVIFNPHLI